MRLATPVGDTGGAEGDPSCLADGHRGLLRAAPSGDDVLDQQNLLPGLYVKAATQGHDAFDPLGEARPYAEAAAHLVPNDQPAECRRHDEAGWRVSCRLPLRS